MNEEQYQYQVFLEETLARLLGHFVSICCVCGKVRVPVKQTGGKETWLPIESYILHHSGIIFSHGYCPECEEEFYEEIDSRSRKLHSRVFQDHAATTEDQKSKSNL